MWVNMFLWAAWSSPIPIVEIRSKESSTERKWRHLRAACTTEVNRT